MQEKPEMVSAEGIESARKRIYNKMQAADVIGSGCKSPLDGQTERR
jgi:hypothetical protein